MVHVIILTFQFECQHQQVCEASGSLFTISSYIKDNLKQLALVLYNWTD